MGWVSRGSGSISGMTALILGIGILIVCICGCLASNEVDDTGNGSHEVNIVCGLYGMKWHCMNRV